MNVLQTIETVFAHGSVSNLMEDADYLLPMGLCYKDGVIDFHPDLQRPICTADWEDDVD